MKIDLRAFILAWTIPLVLAMLVISIWARISGQFGIVFLETFNSIHPHPFTAAHPALLWWEHAVGVLLDFFYVVVDAVILSGAAALLYNRLSASGSNSGVP